MPVYRGVCVPPLLLWGNRPDIHRKKGCSTLRCYAAPTLCYSGRFNANVPKCVPRDGRKNQPLKSSEDTIATVSLLSLYTADWSFRWYIVIRFEVLDTSRLIHIPRRGHIGSTNRWREVPTYEYVVPPFRVSDHSSCVGVCTTVLRYSMICTYVPYTCTRCPVLYDVVNQMSQIDGRLTLRRRAIVR